MTIKERYSQLISLAQLFSPSGIWANRSENVYPGSPHFFSKTRQSGYFHNFVIEIGPKSRLESRFKPAIAFISLAPPLPA